MPESTDEELEIQDLKNQVNNLQDQLSDLKQVTSTSVAVLNKIMNDIDDVVRDLE